MRLLSLSILPFFVYFLLILPAQAQDKAKLTIYTHGSFVTEWGAGPQIRKNFEKECNCELEWVDAGSAVTLLNRLRLEKTDSKADIVLGLDTNLMHEARATGFFAPSNIDQNRVSIPGGFKDDIFVPYDYSYFAVIHDAKKLPEPPQSLQELVEGDPEKKIILQDPRTSTAGLGMLLWMKAVYGEEAGEAWQKLQGRILTITPGWSEAYSLFTGGEAPMVLSYTTSAAYHMSAENTQRYQALIYPEGHYLQIELAAQTVRGAKNPLAGQFLRFMTEPGFQDVIPQTNWMYPAGRSSTPLPEAFDILAKPEKILHIAADEVARKRKSWVNEWLMAISP